MVVTGGGMLESPARETDRVSLDRRASALGDQAILHRILAMEGIFAGSTPIIFTFGLISFAAREMPLIIPPPPYIAQRNKMSSSFPSISALVTDHWNDDDIDVGLLL
jgi:hypothetical protein